MTKGNVLAEESARRSKPAKQGNRAELLTLAQAMLITAIGARGAVPSGDVIRQIVREAREFLSEIDTATAPKRPAVRPSHVDDGPPAEFTDNNEIEW